MKRINFFIKIYLSFWVMTIVILAAVIYLDRLTASGPVIKHWQRTVDKTTMFYAEEVVRVHEREGAEALRKLFSRMERSTGNRAFLFDHNGKEVTGRKVDSEVGTLAGFAIKTSSSKFFETERFSLAVAKVSGQTGNGYTLAVAYPHPPPPHFIPDLVKPGPHTHPPPPGPFPGTPPGPPPDFPPGSLLGLTPGPPGGFPLHSYVRLFIALALSGLACFILARYLTSPIFMMRTAAQKMASGDLSVRVRHALGSRGDELSGLAKDFDLMAERIESLVSSQRNLLRDVSHELRSPLARLRVALELCRKRFGSEGDKQLDRIETEARRLEDLIGQILLLNRIELRSGDLEKTKLNLAELIEEIVSDANFEANRDRAVIQRNETCILEGNRDLLRRAIENVIRNAILHTNEDSSVEVSSLRHQQEDRTFISIAVRDHGEGIPEEELSRIFQPFYKANQKDKPVIGAGLGLTITDAAVRLHGGSVSARNAGDGGLILEILLPVRLSIL